MKGRPPGRPFLVSWGGRVASRVVMCDIGPGAVHGGRDGTVFHRLRKAHASCPSSSAYGSCLRGY